MRDSEPGTKLRFGKTIYKENAFNNTLSQKSAPKYALKTRSRKIASIVILFHFIQKKNYMQLKLTIHPFNHIHIHIK